MKALGKNIIFGLIVTIIFFVFIELILLVFGVEPISERSDPYIGFAGYSPLFVEKTTADGEQVFATADNKMNWFNYQQFPVRKADGVTRVFCLGGSTTYGRPYDDKTSFCGWLREFLPAVDSTRQWEVINAGGISYASYRVVRLMEALGRFEPDLFVIYTGHNEFLENRTYEQLLNTPEFIRDLKSVASRLRIYSLLSDFIYTKDDVLETEVNAILDNSIGPKDYHRDDTMRDAVLEHFQVSLSRMAEIGEEEGTGILFVTPASNIKDFSPFKAEPSAGLDSADIYQINELKQSITELLENNDAKSAAVLTDQALAIDPRDADLLFYKGKVQLALGQIDEARRAFISARDEDIAPLRALTPMPGIITDIANENGNNLVDFARIIEARSPNGIPGEESFLDHVHPTIEGNRIMALAIIDEMIKMGRVTPAATWNNEVISKITRQVKSSVDEETNAMALTNLSRVLTWAGKQEEALRLIDSAISINTDHHTIFQKKAVLVRDGRFEEALPYSARAVRLMPEIATVRRDHGVLLAKLGYNNEAQQELETAARLDPAMEGLYYYLGMVLSELGYNDKAERAYRQAIEIEPENADACYNLSLLLSQRGDFKQAQPYSAIAVRLMPENANVRRTHGVLLSNLGYNEEALRELETASRLDPKMIGLHYNLGIVFYDLGYKDRAESAYRKAVEEEPENDKACNNLGIMLAQRGDIEAAMELFEQALKSNPGNIDAMNNLTRAKRMLGR